MLGLKLHNFAFNFQKFSGESFYGVYFILPGRRCSMMEMDPPNQIPGYFPAYLLALWYLIPFQPLDTRPLPFMLSFLII